GAAHSWHPAPVAVAPLPEYAPISAKTPVTGRDYAVFAPNAFHVQKRPASRLPADTRALTRRPQSPRQSRTPREWAGRHKHPRTKNSEPGLRDSLAVPPDAHPPD